MMKIKTLTKAGLTGAVLAFGLAGQPVHADQATVIELTQTACQLIAHYDTDDAVAAIKKLIVKHPINLLRTGK